MPGVSGQDWQRLLEAQRAIQQHFPDLVLVGGTASALHAGHRFSLDGDHVIADLRSSFGRVVESLEALSGWKTARLAPPVMILGSFEGVETGIRQLRRTEPLETEMIAGLQVPTLAEMTRVKGWMVVTRNATRDYLDFGALSAKLGSSFVEAMSSMDRLYPQETGETALRQLGKQLAEPKPYDLGDPSTLGGRFRGLEQPWQDWAFVSSYSRKLAQTLMDYTLGVSELEEGWDAPSSPEPGSGPDL